MIEARLRRYLLLGFSLLALLVVVAAIELYSLTWRPERNEAAAYRCPAQTPELVAGQTLKVMTWNVQYLAGKRYVFWYDRADGNGPDQRPTPEDLAFNLDEVARVIRDEAPDLVLLQDLDENAKNTDYADQLSLLQARLVDLYPCHAQTFDWKADFVPDAHIYGSVGRKLATLSRYRISHAERVQLPIQPNNMLSRQFQPKRALLISYLPVRDGGAVAVINTQFDKAGGVDGVGLTANGDDTLQRQVEKTLGVLEQIQHEGQPWLIGGTFNLLATDQYQRLSVADRDAYSPNSELHALWDKYPMIPSNNDINSDDRDDWLTYFPNDPKASGPDRTLDYLFYSPGVQRIDAAVRQDDTLDISNHLPVLATLQLPAVVHPAP